jgi:hypothetical protein
MSSFRIVSAIELRVRGEALFSFRVAAAATALIPIW